jgi:hypothetical protein
MPIEPAADEDASQSRRYDGPAKRADHCQILADRPLAFAPPSRPAFSPYPDSLVESLVIF